MPLIIHFFRVPRYKNIITGEYETIPFEDVRIINKYFDWKRARAEQRVACYSLKAWCGVSEDDMPHKYIVNYYSDFYKPNPVYSDWDGELVEKYSIFEDLARFVKSNQVLNWLINNVPGAKKDGNFHEISEDQVTRLCGTLKRTRKCLAYVGDELTVVDVETARELLPVMDEVPLFWGPETYDSIYAEQVVNAYEIIRKILNSTDFKKESIYFIAC